MDTVQVVILALIQGFTEFLPISSSAHLILPAQLLGWQDQGLAFDVAVHIGSLLAVVLYFRESILAMLKAWCLSIVKRKHSKDSQLAWCIILATIPAVLAGLLAKNLIENYLRGPGVIAVTTIVFGLFLWLSDKRARCVLTEYQVGWKQALIVGLAQALALIPGTSRSGVTITVALMLGLTREAAARFSFLMSIPVILGAAILMGKDLASTHQMVDWSAMLLGVGLSFVAAYTCIHLFLNIINRVGMLPFVIYRLFLGVLLIGVIYF